MKPVNKKEHSKFGRIFTLAMVLAALSHASIGQLAPVLSKRPTVTDTTVSGTAQGKSDVYRSVWLFVCASKASPTAPLDCSAEDGAATRKIPLVNLAGSPFVVTAPDGLFTVSLKSAFSPGTYVWIVQVTIQQSTGVRTVQASTPVRVPAPLLRKATIALSGYDSASRDVGATATLDFDHGLTTEGLGEIRFLVSAAY